MKTPTLAAFVLLSAAPALAAGVFFDGFDGQGRPPGWTIHNAPPGNFWFAFEGALVTGDGDSIQTLGGWSYAIAPLPEAERTIDCTVQGDVWMSQDSGSLGLVARWRGPQDHIEGSVEVQGARRIARIARLDSLERSARLELARAEAPGGGARIPPMAGAQSRVARHRLALELRGRSIVLRIDGLEILRADDPNPLPGGAGIMNQWNFAYWDNLRPKYLFSSNWHGF